MLWFLHDQRHDPRPAPRGRSPPPGGGCTRAGATEPNWITFKLPQIEAGERVRAERKAANAAENARIRKAGAAQTAQEAAERVADLFTDRRPATAKQVAYAYDLCRQAGTPRTHQELAEMSQSAISDLIGDLRDAKRGLCPQCGDQTTNPGLCSNCT
jgi:transcription initiation factor TFIIIB Brf1 subunit/transcription initiation factor TFIIB